MKQKRVTSYDVAREAGVSQSAVSRVFRPGFSVSKKTREKVIATANEMGYRPNAIARMLITKQSGMVAVILSSQANLNYPEVLSELNRELALNNKRVLLFTLDNADELDELLENIWTFQVDGVIALAAHFDSKSLNLFAKHSTPIVLYNRHVPESNANTVCCNHDKGIKQLIDLLHQANHKSYLILSGPTDSDVANERREIAENYLHTLGVQNTPVIYGDYGYKSARDALKKWLKKHPKPDAIICSNDAMAIGVIDELKENFCIKVPDDISVVGFDGINASSWYNYQITTVQQPMKQLTKAAVDILMERIENPQAAAEVRVFTGSLIEGNSIKKR
ncbi:MULTISPECIES: LacI family DNA-binding transcriptional regulator [Pseudoalteromonas]|uniref:LacI family DNA-binding transcriptional regulator n=1 Tax=Pseudoalteromonas undina TaxID=43660 RepID=A0ACC6R0K3_9GAMM|nr:MULTISPECIES: LacI family DNA-binding transcriptional regulator [unclassified Pseudoalteromonas]KPZ60094.1 Catabolite control protein A [Pseudoalteromonas sp. P1-13-1a]BED88673.1 LacI family transcriptional regulator [Pseudoalteromonas sp. MM1]